MKYRSIKCARFAKKQLDGKSFYGGVFHVCYAPELESVQETREKLEDRRLSIAALTEYRQDPSVVNPSKKKYEHATAGKYLSRLRPELQDPNSTPHTRVNVSQSHNNTELYKMNPGQVECSSHVSMPVDCSYNIIAQSECSDGMSLQPQNSNMFHKEAECSNNTPAGSIIPADMYKIPSALLPPDVKEQHPVVLSDPSGGIKVTQSSKVVNVKKSLLVPRSVKRSLQSPALASNNKKIKVFGNKKILSYKSSTGGEGVP